MPPRGRRGARAADALGGQVPLQGVPVDAAHHVQMPDVAAGLTDPWQADVRVADAGGVRGGDAAAALGIGIETAKFDAQHGGLKLIQSAVDPAQLMHVLGLRTVVAQRPQRVCQGRIGGGDGAAVTERAEVLAGIEAESRGINPGPSGP